MRQWQQGRCYLCGRVMGPRIKRTFKGMHSSRALFDSATIDHIHPYVEGGRRSRNIALACYGCNRDSGHTLPTACEIAFGVWLWEDLFPRGLQRDPCQFSVRLRQALRDTRSGYRSQGLIRLW